MSLHKEVEFENDICHHLAQNGWLYHPNDHTVYNRELALFVPDVLEWVQQAQPQAWRELQKLGNQGQGMLLHRLRKQLDDLGTLAVLRQGIEMVGLRQRLPMAQFKPALAMNQQLQAQYAANRLRVVRQVRYSAANQNALDLVLFINGIPVATAELKSDFTQSVHDAIDQYRYDRDPKPKGSAGETLLQFGGGALVHFAVSNSEVYMTTHLEGTHTRFLPFNQGHNGAAGNPPNPHGHPSAYLWEQVWERESWLEILGRYLVSLRNNKQKLSRVIFPRYHQLDATRKLVQAVRQEGAGQRYLIQHSAGSGKTNSIAWAAHFLADLHNQQNQKVFDSVLVVSDRRVLDSQLQAAIFGFERTTGVVAVITGEHQSKSGELAAALSGGKKIVVCTLQTFPFAMELIQKEATLGKRFAVIADEAHSSQTGEAARKLRLALQTPEDDEISSEDVLVQQAQQNPKAGISYIAFTATPKAKTLEMFGRTPQPQLPAGPGNLPQAFHVYSMRQAIEEGFILDVLQNYTPYKLAFKLANGGKEYDETQVERSAALKGIMRWVRLHPYNIGQKVAIVIEHFLENVAPLIGGTAKAMVVTASRVEAVRWKLAMDEYIKRKGYPLGTLVAFSGEVNDPQSHPDPLSENSAVLNPLLRGQDLAQAFAATDYQILLVANKFQTGFDQPLLCGMYIDKRLAGLQAVQTLSRLNRAHPGKDTTYVLDFVNEPQEILQAFQTYYQTAQLSGVTDPNLPFDLKAQLDAAGHYSDAEVERVVQVEQNPKATQAELIAALTPVADRLLRSFHSAKQEWQRASANREAQAQEAAQQQMEALEVFRHNMGAFLRAYTFLAQIFDYGNSDLEKRAVFFRRLLPLLEFGREREQLDLSKLQLTHHSLKDKGRRRLELQGDGPKLDPLSAVGSAQVHNPDKVRLSEIIAKVNDLFEGELTDSDKLVYVNQVLKGKLLESEVLALQAAHNTKEQFANSPDLASALTAAIIEALSAHTAMSTQALNSPKVLEGLRDILLGPAQLYEALQELYQSRG